MSLLKVFFKMFAGWSNNADRLMTVLVATNARFGSSTIRKVLRRFRREVISESFIYPSLINNGYLHIERIIEVVKSRKLGGNLVLDIGAAGGETARMFASAFPSASIFAFEPIKTTFEKLQSNTKDVGNISIHNIALGSVKKESSINITGRVTSSSIFPTSPNEYFDKAEPFKITSTEQIRIDRLDEVVNSGAQVDLIKMDVQGFELEVLQGGVDTLTRTAFLLLEMQNHQIYQGAPKYYEVDEFLRNHGFELFDIIPSIRVDMQVKEFDAIYINKSLTNKA
jgi:FkbM family methyltransferase